MILWVLVGDNFYGRPEIWLLIRIISYWEGKTRPSGRFWSTRKFVNKAALQVTPLYVINLFSTGFSDSAHLGLQFLELSSIL